MFIVIPLSHEQNVARRWPWVTTIIVLLNIAVFLAFLASDERAADDMGRAGNRALEYYVQHPEVELGEEFQRSIPAFARAAEAVREQALAAAAEDQENASPGDPGETQPEFDALMRALVDARLQMSAWRYGYLPHGGSWSGLFSHQFFHADFFHLLFNIWFLWLLGCNVEDAWGRLLFPAFYLSAGAVAGWVHGIMSPESGTVLIGASGAVAAAMGAFLVRFGRTKIRFFGLFFIRPFTFGAPAYLMLPLWVAIEVFMGLSKTGSGVAHWAHVGGFAYGFAIALGLVLSGAGQKLEAAVEDQGETFTVDPELVRASAAIDAGNTAAAIAQLEKMSHQRSASPSVFLELARAKAVAGDAAGAHLTKLRLVEWYLHKQQPGDALEVFEEASKEQAEAPVPHNLRLRLARQYRRSGNLERAASEFALIHAAPKASEYSLPALLGHAELSLELGRNDVARELFQRAQFFASRDAHVQAAIRQGLARAGHRSSTAPPPPA